MTRSSEPVDSASPTTSTKVHFDGDVAIVTGAGAGLGRGYATALAARGARVVCNDIDADAAAATVEQITDAGGTAVAQGDSVASPAGGAAIVERALDAFGSVEIVINNAGQIRPAPFEEMAPEHFDDVLRTHLYGAFHVTQPAYAHMKRAGYGRVLFTSSSSGVFGSPWAANYASAKAGLLGLSNVVAAEGAEHGITSNVVMPQALGTDMGTDAGAPYPPEYLAEILEAFGPFMRHTTVDNVVPWVVFLAHRSCEATQRVYSVGCGHVGRVFVGATRGWFAPGLTCSTPEEVAAHLHAVEDTNGFTIPSSAADELRHMDVHHRAAQSRDDPEP